MTALAATNEPDQITPQTLPRYRQALQRLPGNRSPTSNPHYSTAQMQAKALQDIMVEGANDPKTPPMARAALARAWCTLQETIRVIRGIPSPGQLRPDLDPVQLKRAMKRARGRQPIEIAQMVNAAAGASMVDADTDETMTPEVNAAEKETRATPARKVKVKPETPAETPPTPEVK